MIEVLILISALGAIGVRAKQRGLSRVPYILLALFGWLSIQVYRSKTDPESFQAWDGPYAWIVDPRTALVFSRISRPTNSSDRITPTTAIPFWTFAEKSVIEEAS